MAKEYSQKLKDPRWQKKRLEVFERDNWKCTICQDETETLNVHHKSYKGEPWDVELSELTTLCESCHDCVSKLDLDVSCDIKCIKINYGKVYLILMDEHAIFYHFGYDEIFFGYEFLATMFSLLTDKININGKEND